ncbi:unnamed protein product [marine sediment metagenome]|uniref:IclR-ED domain-containing protein n=1 Tax=marine sediment metagenome TaxID=412755 RepID=X1DK60_9ZZZZ
MIQKSLAFYPFSISLLKIMASATSRMDLRVFMLCLWILRYASSPENTITNVEKLKEELKEIRTKGYAFDDQEVRLGVRRIAAPIFDHSKKIAGVIGIAGPTFRMRQGRKEELGRIVKQAAEEISNELGWEKSGNKT